MPQAYLWVYMEYLTVATALLQLSVFLPLAWFARRSMQPDAGKYIQACMLLFIFDVLLTASLNISISPGQQWNWVGETASLTWGLIFIYTTALVSKKETGWILAIQNRKSVFLIMFVLLLVRIVLRLVFQGSGGYRMETFLFEASLPGLSQEIVFRGILLALLNKAFGTRRTIMQTKAGWALIITSVLFGSIHGLSITRSWMPDFNSQRFIMTSALGFVLGYLKERSQSLVPAILFHNIWNLIAFMGR